MDEITTAIKEESVNVNTLVNSYAIIVDDLMMRSRRGEDKNDTDTQ